MDLKFLTLWAILVLAGIGLASGRPFQLRTFINGSPRQCRDMRPARSPPYSIGAGVIGRWVSVTALGRRAVTGAMAAVAVLGAGVSAAAW